jgi:hypothetical protein
MNGTLLYVLSPGSQQFFNYIETWSRLPLAQVDVDPIHPNLSMIDITSVDKEDHVRFRLANDCLSRGYGHYGNLMTALGVNGEALKQAITEGVPFRHWFWLQKDHLAWYRENRAQANVVLEDLLQMTRCLNQAALRVEEWKIEKFRRSPQGMEQHFHWLRGLLTRRARLAGEALGSQSALSVFFDEERRRMFNVGGLEDSMAEFFGIRIPVIPARLA